MEGSRYKGYLLAILSAILAFNYLDRLALGLLLQDIKADLALTDTQLGVLSGIAFALFYSVMGIPLARWADRGNRVTIIALTTALWSAAVALCAAAGSFVHLLLIRIGVAVGEAGCIPPAHSLIADHFTRAERPRAVARYMLGVPISYLAGYFLAGWLNQLYGWRTTFALLGLPGLVLVPLAWFSLKEPRRKKNAELTGSTSSHATLKNVFTTLWANETFRHLLIGYSVLSFFGNGVNKWLPTFFIRSFGMETGVLGSYFAVIYGIGGLIGTYCGGELSCRYAANNERLQLIVIAALYCGFGVMSACIYLSPNQYTAFALMTLATIGVFMVSGPLFATIQTLVPPHMRAMSVALIYLFANLIGMGLGPFVVGVASDALRPLVGEESLRYALLAMCPGYLWVAWHLWRGSRTVIHDLERT